MTSRLRADNAPNQDSSTDRSSLSMFTKQGSDWTTHVMSERPGVGHATMYRHIRTLLETGFLSPNGRGA